MPAEIEIRPPVAVVVPFFGEDADADHLVAALRAIRLRAGDELIVADNTQLGVRWPDAPGVRIVRAPLERSSYYARNVGVEATSAAWLLFVDSDTRPAPDVLDAYFADPIPDAVGVVSGSVLAAEDQTELIARYARSRGHIDPEHYRRGGRRPAGITANLLVRRAAWEAVGGFHEGVKSGADLEFCWRVQDAGWAFDWRVSAHVEHEHVDNLPALARKTIRHAGGGGWVNRRYPGAFSRPRITRGLLRCGAGVVVWTAAGQRERALFKAIDAVFLVADAYGRLTGNRAARDPSAPARPADTAVVPVFPADGVPEGVAVEALRRPVSPEREARRRRHVLYLEDDGVADRLFALVAIVAGGRREVRRLRSLAARLDLTPLTAAPLARRLRSS